MVMSLCPYVLVNIPKAAARHRHSLLRLLLSLLRLVVGCFCFVLARFFFEFDDLHIRSAVAQVDTGAACCIRCCTLRSGRAFRQVSRLRLRHNPHTLDWPCRRANNLRCQAGSRGYRIGVLSRNDSVYSGNVRHHN